jgi:undecaprenyl phosphate N,N'-diacetylbacillosamine 1-phosphate transferase
VINVAFKYMIERLLCIIVFIIILPILLLIAGVIKMTSKGSIFYITKRVGYNGKSFNLLKFRSMFDNVPPVLTQDLRFVVEINDKRVTPIGKILRIGFDELPQLWNVIKGEMTLIGPRPHNASFVKYYNENVSKRLKMLPGITSLAVVCNGRSLSDAENNMLDVYYIENYSYLMDITILIYTILYMIGFRSIGNRLLNSIRADHRYDIKLFDITSNLKITNQNIFGF